MRVTAISSNGGGEFSCLLLRIIILTIALLPSKPGAEVVIELTDGRQILVPVDKEDVKSIGFHPSGSTLVGGSGGVSNSSGEPPGAASYVGKRVLRVGPNRELKFPSDAARIAGDGDVIEIDSDVYHNDYATWPQSNLTIRGVGDGMAHLKSIGLIPNLKAIWILQGSNIHIENIEFSGAAVRDTNGAGIRHEGGDLTLSNTFFHDNEFSILSGDLPDASIEIESSRFWFQKRNNRYSHGIYIGAARSFTLKGSHVKGTDQGHQVKSRALENFIIYNRIEDVPGGNSSRLVDLSNCGFSIVMGNDLHQAATTENSNVIGYGAENCPRRTERQMKLFVVNNTLVNEARNGTLVRNFAGGHVTVSNNLIFGRGSFLSGAGVDINNFRESLKTRTKGSWDAPRGGKAVDGAVTQPPVEGIRLTPESEFLPPVGFRERLLHKRLDAGSREKNS
jgi:hypothetical protein